MAFTGTLVDADVARALSEISVPDGTMQDPDTYHVTMLYLGKKVPVEDIMKAIRVTLDVTQDQDPFDVSTSLVTSFPANPDDGIPVIAKVESQELHDLNAKLRAAYVSKGVHFDSKYPEYKPHVTLAYADPGTFVKDQRIQEVKWKINKLVMWCGDKSHASMTVELPFRGIDPQIVTAGLKVVEAALRLV